MRKPLLTTELAIIRQHYPKGGPKACNLLLPHRSFRSISLFAWKHGIRRESEALKAERMRFIGGWKWTLDNASA